MPPPYLAQENFEQGTLGTFDSETDTQSKLTIRHYRELPATPVREMPYRGAYVAHIDLSLGTADAYFEEALVVAGAATRYVRFYLYVQDLVMAANDRFTVFQLQSAGPISEAVVDIRNTGGVIELLLAETGAAATVRATQLRQNQWHAVELRALIDSGAGNDGVLEFFVDGRPVGTTITALDQEAIAQLRWGAMGIDATTTAGHLLLDELVVDDMRIYPLDGRYPTTRHLTQTAHVAVGPGMIEDVYLLDAGSADARMELYDSDNADPSAGLILAPFTLTSGYRQDEKFTSVGTFARGVYAVLSGTNPQGFITLKHGVMSVGGVRDVATRRR